MLFSVLFGRIITKSTEAILFRFFSDEDTCFVTRDVLGMGAGADPGYFVTGLNCGKAAMVIRGSGGKAPRKIF